MKMKGGCMQSALQKAVIPEKAVKVLNCNECDKLVRLEDADECPPLYECSIESCGTTFVGIDGRNCPECNRPFSRKLAAHACENCEEEMEETTAFECENDGCSQDGLHLVEEEAKRCTKKCKGKKIITIPAPVPAQAKDNQPEQEVVDQGLLTTAEEKRKEELVKVIKDGLLKFVQVGMALAEIRDEKLYRSTHETFEKFVNDTFSMGIRYAQMLMKGTKAVENLKTRTRVRLPEREAQVRPLAIFDDQPDTQAKVWELAVEKAGGESPAPAIVRDTVDEYLGIAPIETEELDEDELKGKEALGEEIGAPPTRMTFDSDRLRELKFTWDYANKTDRKKFCLYAGLRSKDKK
jgi:hypothetical protein